MPREKAPCVPDVRSSVEAGGRSRAPARGAAPSASEKAREVGSRDELMILAEGDDTATGELESNRGDGRLGLVEVVDPNREVVMS